MLYIHGVVGELQYKGRSVRDLAKAGIFFYDHFYQLLDHAHSYGILQRQDFLEWNIIDWPVPDGSIIEAYRAKLYAEVQHSLKPNIATRIVKITIFMPINVFVDIFQEFSIKVVRLCLLLRQKPVMTFQSFWTMVGIKLWPTLCIVRLSMTRSISSICLPPRILFSHFTINEAG